MRCVSWDEFVNSSEALMDEALRQGKPLYVRRNGEIVLELMPTEVADEAEEGGVRSSDRAAIAERWCEAQEAELDNL